MKLKRFLVTAFRSVDESGWIETPRVSSLIGVNESGKTNILIPLWKLNPAREGEIQPTADYPKKRYGEIRDAPGRFCFIAAEFETGPLREELAARTGQPPEKLQLVHVKRYFDGRYEIEFPDCRPERTVAPEAVLELLREAEIEIPRLTALTREVGVREAFQTALTAAKACVGTEPLAAEQLREIAAALRAALPEEAAKTSTIVPRFTRLIDAIEEKAQQLGAPAPGEGKDVVDLVVSAMPKFVYYSTYGNLDSEIYLPQVVHNLKRTDLGTKEAAKARTLRVLFKFVRLSPDEILELGRDFKDLNNPTRKPTDAEIATIAEHKRERSILLQSAGTTLTQRFKEWWKQGNYRFRFEADGDHFRIWVSDDKRPEEVELESRSTGLQWFLSFYLVFLVESEEEHRDAVLLLDEPGLSLHPLAQRDLSEFFDGLSRTNQIVYTTHSPFLVDADHLDRARKVYVASDGTSKVTDDLRQGRTASDQAGAAYAVYSALNLNVAESLLLGCQPIIVEGTADQHYMTAIKALLIGAGKLTPKRELVFPPSGGSKTARITASIITGRDEVLPKVLLDDDAPGRRAAQELRSNLYQDAQDRILSVADFTGIPGSEIEDLFPVRFLAKAVDRLFREPEVAFEEVVREKEPVVPQVEAWATAHGVALEKGWKVELAKRAKQIALDRGIGEFSGEVVERWIRLFTAFD